MSSTTTRTTRPLPRKLRLVLLVSLAFNLLFVGLVVGMIIKGPPDGAHREGGDRGARDFYSQALGREDRRVLREKLQVEGIGFAETGRLMRGNLEAIVTTLRAEPFDAQAFSAAVKGRDLSMETVRRKGQEVFVDYVSGLDADARAEIASRLEAFASRGPKR